MTAGGVMYWCGVNIKILYLFGLTCTTIWWGNSYDSKHKIQKGFHIVSSIAAVADGFFYKKKKPNGIPWCS